jgi:hypothetical protein
VDPKSVPGRRGEEKILDLTETRTTTTRSSRPQPVAIPTALCRFTYIACSGLKIADICFRVLTTFKIPLPRTRGGDYINVTGLRNPRPV